METYSYKNYINQNKSALVDTQRLLNKQLDLKISINKYKWTYNKKEHLSELKFLRGHIKMLINDLKKKKGDLIQLGTNYFLRLV